MRGTASEIIRNLEMRIARLEKQSSEEIDVQYSIEERGRTAVIDLYFSTDDHNLADMVSAFFDTKWTHDSSRPGVSVGSYSDRQAGVDLRTVHIKLRGADIQSVGQRGYMKMVKEALDKIDRGGFKLRFVREITFM